MRSLKISAFADEYTDSFEEQLTALNEFGIENIEIRFLNGKNISVLKRNEATEAKKKLDAFGINVSAIGSPIGKIQLDGDINDHLETAKRIFESANIFDTRYIRVFSFYAPNGKDIADMKSEVLYYLENFVVLAREYGITLCLETVHWCAFSTPDFFKVVKEYAPNIGVTLDIKQAWQSGYDWNEYLDVIGDRLKNVHLCDHDKDGNICMIGKGVFPFDKLIARLKEDGYQGPIIIEQYAKDYDSYDQVGDSVQYLNNIIGGIYAH